jgi:hypothetical protein
MASTIFTTIARMFSGSGRASERAAASQADLFGEPGAVRHVTGDDLGALVGTQAIVRIVALLVLDEVLGRSKLADVVIQRADTREQRVCADRATRVLRELADSVRVLVRSRRAQRELAQHRQIGVRELEQFDVGQDSEE